LRNNSGKQYKAKSGDCAKCHLIDECISKRNGKTHARTLYIINRKYERNLCEEMKEKIDDPVNRELYSRRMQIIEPVFSNIVNCKGMNRFTLRTREKVNNQWQLYCIVHNMWKCMTALRQKYGYYGSVIHLLFTA
jgi:flagellar motor switch protein FliM